LKRRNHFNVAYVGAHGAGAEPGETINNVDNYQLFLKAVGPELISACELTHSHTDISLYTQYAMYIIEIRNINSLISVATLL